MLTMTKSGCVLSGLDFKATGGSVTCCCLSMSYVDLQWRFTANWKASFVKQMFFF